MLRKMFIFLFLMLISAQFVSAKEVTVEGVGADRDSALSNAFKQAVEQVVGVFIDSNTITRNLIVELDEIYSKSQGYINNVKILNEQQKNGLYRIKAIIDVDSEPNSKLMNNLMMLYKLNDPRITVIILKSNNATNVDPLLQENSTQFEHDSITETAMNEKLISLGFNHVVDAKQIIRLKDAQLLNEIYNGRDALNEAINKDNSVDYLILGKSRVDIQNVSIPEYGGKKMIETSLIEAKADLDVKIIKYDTGDIVGTFSTESKSADNSNSRAAEKALKLVSEKAANELSNTFKKFSSKSNESLQIIVSADSYEKVEQFRKDLFSIKGVQNVYIREHNNNKTTLEIETTYKSHTLIQLLIKNTKLGVFVENMSNSLINLKLT